jgi:hypothetical protein
MQDELADREVVPEDPDLGLEEGQVAGVVLAAQPAGVEVGQEPHHPGVVARNAEHPSRPGIDVRLVQEVRVPNLVDAAVTDDRARLEAFVLALHRMERSAGAERMLAGGGLVELRLQQPLDLRVEEEHGPAQHDHQQHRPGRQGDPSVQAANERPPSQLPHQPAPLLLGLPNSKSD